MTRLLTPTTAPKGHGEAVPNVGASGAVQINKVYRRLWRVNGVTAYLNVSAEGQELLTIGSNGSVSRHIIGGWCEDCAFGPECTWPECPKRFPQSRVPDSPTPTRDQESENTEAVDPSRAMPAPPSPVEDAVQDVIDEPVEPAPAEPEVEPVSPEVQQAAKALAFEVWSSGSIPRDHLFAGLLPALAEEYLNQAIAMQWVVIAGDRIAPGAVSPVPMTALPSERSSRGWLSSVFR